MLTTGAMKTTLLAAAAATALIGFGATPSSARDGENAAAAAGVIGGLAAGAAIASGAGRYAEPGPVYRQRRVIVEDDAEECRVVVRRRVNEFGEVVTRRSRICD